jgi:hypothetical protein
MRVLQALKQCQPGLESRGSDFAAELESAGASSRMDEIDLRGRFSRRFFRFGASLPPAVAGVRPTLMNERDFPLS